jgi:hypothetical protein
MYDFLDLPFREADFAVFARPHNVNTPQDRLLDARQAAQFEAIAGAMMQTLGYAGTPEYAVNY